MEIFIIVIVGMVCGMYGFLVGNTIINEETHIHQACRNEYKELVAYEKCVEETKWSDTTAVLKSSLNKGDKNG